MMDYTVLLIFAAVYAGMMLGEIPGLAIDRTGVALLGAIALLVARRVSPQDAWRAVDVSTLALLFGLMVVSSQLRLSGFYAAVTRRVTGAALPASSLLAALVITAGALSAVLANDIVCLAMAPIVIAGCEARRLDARPFLLGLAAAANVGSAATLIGNPQNMLIGQVLALSFVGYLRAAAVPAILGLAVVWAVIHWRVDGQWTLEAEPIAVDPAPLERWQTTKGLLALALLVVAFVATDWPRDVLALGAAGVLLLSRRMASREMLGRVDGQLLLLFMALFVVNHALAASGTLATLERGVATAGIDLRRPVWLFGSAVVLSNLVSNVPAVMLLLPLADAHVGGAILALASTLAGNLLLVGSIANLIVVDQAARLGVRIGWAEHARVGVPVTILTLALAAAWLWLLYA